MTENVGYFRGCQSRFRWQGIILFQQWKDKLPDCLKITAKTADGEIMAVSHREDPVYGLQFHPESIMTPDGMTILKNFLEVR